MAKIRRKTIYNIYDKNKNYELSIIKIVKQISE